MARSVALNSRITVEAPTHKKTVRMTNWKYTLFRSRPVTKRFALWCLPLVSLAAMTLVYAYNHSIESAVYKTAETIARSNQAILTNVLWPKYSDFLLSDAAENQSPNNIAPQTPALSAEIYKMIENTSILKIKMYSPSGITIFSTDFNQIGDDYSERAGYISAVNGKAYSDNSFRPNFKTMHGERQDIEILATYLPVFQNMENTQVAAVVEIYVDVTGIANESINSTTILLLVGTTPVVLMIVFALLFSVVAITEERLRKESIQRLESAKIAAKAEAANQSKSEFLANMSHEIRTPLNAIIGFAEVIRDQFYGPKENPKYQDAAGDIHKAGRHLLVILNDILDLAKIEAGRMTVRSEWCDITALLTDALQYIELSAARKNITLNVTSKNTPQMVSIDPVKMTQILLNIITNAVKYTPDGGEIWISLVKQKNGPGIEFKCRDNGIGMTPEELVESMTPFGRGSSAYSTKVRGTGLGLPLTKEFARLLNGHLEINSEKGSGTLVRICFAGEELSEAA